LTLRTSKEETFLETYRRTGIDPFKAALYEGKDTQDAA
jgi:sulfite reductase (NADPH) hemoprotein beta-component